MGVLLCRNCEVFYARCVMSLVLMAIPLIADSAPGRTSLKTRVCTAQVLHYTDWASCERRIEEATAAETCVAWAKLCIEGCSSASDKTCSLQCSARGAICTARLADQS